MKKLQLVTKDGEQYYIDINNKRRVKLWGIDWVKVRWADGTVTQEEVIRMPRVAEVQCKGARPFAVSTSLPYLRIHVHETPVDVLLSRVAGVDVEEVTYDE